VDTASQLLILGGTLNIAYGFLTGFFMGVVSSAAPETPKYLSMAHVGALMQGTMLFGLVFAFEMSQLPTTVETISAGLLVTSTVLLNTKDTINWRQGVTDEFAQKSLGLKIGMIYGPVATVGLGMILWGVVQAFVGNLGS